MFLILGGTMPVQISFAQEDDDSTDYDSSSDSQSSEQEQPEDEYDESDDQDYEEDTYEEEQEEPQYSPQAPASSTITESSPFDDEVSIGEDDIVTVNVLGNDRAYMGWDRNIRIVETTEPSFGDIIVNSDGTITYSPIQISLPSGYQKADVFQYTATADGVSAYTGTITIWIVQVNDAPVATASNYTIKENVRAIFYLEAVDEDGDSLTYEMVSATEFGEAEIDEYSGRLTYTPLYEFSGEDRLTFRASDGVSTSQIAEVVITVEEVGSDSSPYFDDDDDQEPEPTDTGANDTLDYTVPVADAGDDFDALTGDLVFLDGEQSYDLDDDPLSYEWSQLAGPEVVLEDSDSYDPRFTAPEVESDTAVTFELAVSDGNATDTATVTVTVKPISIDLIPNIYPNVIQLSQPDSEVPVAILGANILDLSAGVDATLLELGPNAANPVWWETSDVNSDGFTDHVSYYRTGDLGLAAGEKIACFSGTVETLNGNLVAFTSCKNVKVFA